MSLSLRLSPDALGPLAGLAGRARSALLDVPSDPDLRRRLRAVSPRRGARRIGRAYLAGAPWEANAGRLVELIVGLPAGWQAALARLDDDQLRQAMDWRRRRDLAKGRTVTVLGKVLPRTEARLCALATLA